MKIVAWVLAATLLCPPALGCMNAVEVSIDEATRVTAEVEKALEEGRAQEAMDKLGGMVAEGIQPEGFSYGVEPELLNFSVKKEGKKRPLSTRLQRLYAVAILRARPQRVLDAYTLLQKELEKSPRDPYLLARRAEAQVVLRDIGKKLLKHYDLEVKEARKKDPAPDYQATDAENRKAIEAKIREAKQARPALEKLAAGDLLVDAEGYALLGRLRREARDAAGADAALERCKTMARNAAVQCAPAQAAPGAAAN